MSPNRRIALNAAATYGRSLLNLLLGLFSSRWVLMSLGAENLGLYGLIAGLVTFISFFNGLFAGSITRFYAYSVGESSREGAREHGMSECRAWFTTAVSIHVVLPTVLMLIGYPIGEYAVRHWLVIPAERIGDCVVIFRFVCVTTWVSMAIVPLSAMYTAKQKIAELTVYSVCGTLLNFAFVGYMVTHPRPCWLVPYVGFVCLISVIPNLLIAVRAIWLFPECRLVRSGLFDRKRLREVCNYSFWTMLGGIGYMLDIQGRSILINKGFGPVFNATAGIAGSVSGHCTTLSGALGTAFMPAIVNLAGEGNRARMLKLSYGGAKISMLLCMVFVLPFMAEREAILDLWLRNPPPLVSEACLWTLLTVLVAQMAFGLETSLQAINKVGYINVASLTSHILAVLAGWLGVFVFKRGFVFVLQVELLRLFAYNFVGCLISMHYTGYSVRIWVADMLLKPAVLLLACELVGMGVGHWLKDFHMVRMLCVMGSVEVSFLVLAWLFALTTGERAMIVCKGRELFACRWK